MILVSFFAIGQVFGTGRLAIRKGIEAGLGRHHRGCDKDKDKDKEKE